MKHTKSFYLLAIFFLCLGLAGPLSAATRTVYNDAEPREGFPFPSNTKVRVTQDSLISVFSFRDIGLEWTQWSYANGANAAFSQKDSIILGDALVGFTCWESNDTLYTIAPGTANGDKIIIDKLYGGNKVVRDTIGTDSGSYNVGSVAFDGSNWIALQTRRAATGPTYYWNVWRLTGANIGGATDWTWIDTIKGNTANTQQKASIVPIKGGLLAFNQYENNWNLVENRASGGITKRITLTIKKKNASTAINGAQSLYDMSVTPVNPTGAGDTLLVATCDSTTNKVWVYLIRADTSANTLTKVDSAAVSTQGDMSDILDSAAWRTPTITMMGTGFAIYYRDWADTTNLADTRIAYHVATDWHTLSTIGAVQYLSTDSAGAGGTIGAIMAPWRTVKHNHADSTYAYVAWARWDAVMNIYATYIAIAKPGDGDQQISSSRRRKLLLGGD
jgi:hypothetical protein